MPRRIALKPRKTPAQDRAKATVDAILQAAAYILVKDGWEGFTTNSVAERAGVNVASLYQYFPNKESIAVELQLRHIEKGRRASPDAILRMQSQASLRDALKILIDGAIAEHRVNPRLHKVFAEELPRASRHLHGNRGEELNALLADILKPYPIQVPDLDIALFLLRVTTHAAIHEAACDRPDLLANPLFTEELLTLIERYMVRSDRRGRSAKSRTNRQCDADACLQ
ncbi:MAG TPA: TetR/AcrR family transcriptional regulator [Terracidiphilus sp.]|nr:TetR/AcrR family transcriptional regulator [Terracidiphilus sp.]